MKTKGVQKNKGKARKQNAYMKASADVVVKKRKRTNRRNTGRPGQNILSKYLMCRMDPINHAEGVGIPDQASGKRIVVDVRQFIDVTFSTSGSVAMVLIPSPSNPLLIKDTVSATSGGSVSYGYATRSLTTTRELNTTGSWISVAAEQYSPYLAASPVAPTTTTHPYFANSMRIVAQAAKIYYTGKPFEASGTITVTPNNTSTTDTEINAGPITRYQANGTVQGTSYAPNTVLVRYANFNFSSTPIAGTICPTLVEGAYVLNKRTTPVSTFADTGLAPIVLVEEDRVTALLSSGVGVTASGLDTIADFDPSFSTPNILVSGGTPGQTFRVEVVTCVEYMLDPRSAFAPLAVDRPSVSPAQISAADAKVAKLPIAATNKNWMNIVGSALEAGLASAGTAFAGPIFGSALGTITNTFKRMWM